MRYTAVGRRPDTDLRPTPDRRAAEGRRRLAIFAAVGLVNAGVYFGGYFALLSLAPYLFAHMFSVLLATVGSYFLHCRLTFKTPPRMSSFLLFLASNAVNFAMGTAGVGIAVGIVGVSKRLAPFAVGALSIPLTFATTRYVLVGRRQAASSSNDSPQERSTRLASGLAR